MKAESHQLISIRDDLSQGLVNTMMQCSEGFLWIGTKDGLNRYDGYEIKVFSPNPDEQHFISDHHINIVFEDSRGLIWIGHLNRGLDVYNKRTGRFYPVLDSDDYRDLWFRGSSVYSLEENEEGDILVGTGKGLLLVEIPESLNLPSDKLEIEDEVFGFKAIWPGGEIVSSIYSEEKLFWGTETNLYYYNPASDKVESLGEIVNEGLVDARTGILNIFFDSSGAMWLVRPHWVTRVESETAEHFPLPVTWDDPQAGFAIMDDNQFLISGYGLYIYTYQPNGEMHRDTLVSFDEFMARTLIVDHSGIVWLGTNGYGIRKFNPFKRDFNHLLSGYSMRSIADFDDRHLLLIADLNLHKLDLFTGELKSLDRISEGFSDVKAVFKCSNGYFWFHRTRDFFDSALIWWDTESDVHREFTYEQESDALSPIWEDDNGQIILANAEGELMFFDTESEVFTIVDLKGEVGLQKQHFNISNLIQTDADVFWLGSTQGLIRLVLSEELEIEDIDLFVNQPGNPNSLGTNHLYSLYQDEKDRDILWIGTRGNGLNRFNMKSGQFKRITAEDGLPNNVVYGILPYERKLWLSTNYGLSVFDRDNYEFSNFTIDEGLQDNEFNAYSYFISSSGKLVFGGINGINYFDPGKIRNNTRPPNIEITALEINDFDGNLSIYYGSGNSALELKHYQNILRFRYSALDFVAPSKNIFKYRLIGAAPDWVEAGTQREVSFANLPPGNYRFEVIGTNNSGVWSEEPAVFYFHIAKPWWNTHLAWTFYSLLLLSGLFALYRFKVNRVMLKNRFEFEKREAERLKELDKVKSDFFSNITHDFRTPLSLIIDPVREIIKKTDDQEVREKLRLVENSSQNLENLINQLLGLNKLDQGLLEENVSLGNIRAFLETITNDFQPLVEKKGIELSFHTDSDPGLLWFDDEKLHQVVSNLLTNAIKFTPKGGSVLVGLEAHNHISEKNTDVKIVISDSGPGIPAQYHEQIFERFYRVSTPEHNNSSGSGIGLSIVKEFVELMDGTICIDSRSEKGASFVIELNLLRGPADSANEKVLPGQKSKPSQQEVLYRDFEGDTDRELVLIAEDNESLRNYIKSYLSQKYHIIEATNGNEGVEMAVKFIPDLILSDWMMPGKSGIEMCSYLKNHPLTCHIPVVLLTAKTALKSRLESYENQADAYFTKPFSIEEIEGSIASLLANRRAAYKYRPIEEAGIGSPSDTSNSNITGENLDGEFLKKLHRVLKKQLDNQHISTEDIAMEMHISRTQLHRKLKAISGESTTGYINNYKLTAALSLLKTGKFSVKEVAFMVGFSDPKYFSRRFKKKFGESPGKIASFK
ncbi:MAG: hybrid sensor histidine kinase/response regulator [Saprospirales bacterium]|nr:MAG: hybrid sensor histidine kinase/response regulator [Saprospirales bacterium]